MKLDIISQPIQKDYLNRIKGLNVRPKTMKLLEEIPDETSQDIGTGNKFMDAHR